MYFRGEAQSSGLARFVFLRSETSLFSRAEVSTLKDLFGLASSGKRPLRAWRVGVEMRVGLVCLRPETLGKCPSLSTCLVLKCLSAFRA